MAGGHAGGPTSAEIAEAIRAGHMLVATADGRIVGCPGPGRSTRPPPTSGSSASTRAPGAAASAARSSTRPRTLPAPAAPPRCSSSSSSRERARTRTRSACASGTPAAATPSSATVPFEDYVPHAAPFLTAPGDILVFTKPPKGAWPPYVRGSGGPPTAAAQVRGSDPLRGEGWCGGGLEGVWLASLVRSSRAPSCTSTPVATGSRRSTSTTSIGTPTSCCWDRSSCASGWRCLAYCLMNNHVHLLVETPEPNLAAGMHAARAARPGVQQAARALRACLPGAVRRGAGARRTAAVGGARYIALNPVEAGLCEEAGQWPWGSHAAVVGGTRSAVAGRRAAARATSALTAASRGGDTSSSSDDPLRPREQADAAGSVARRRRRPPRGRRRSRRRP